MEKIILSKKDKLVLKNTFDDSMDVDVLPKEELYVIAKHLESIGLIEIQMYNDEFRTGRLTNFGKKYKLENPKLRNGISDTTKWLIPMIITILVSIASLIIQILK